jgi:hypothetical protein
MKLCFGYTLFQWMTFSPVSLSPYTNRKENKEDQLMAAQAYLKLGEVGAESGMISICCFLFFVQCKMFCYG